MRLGELEEIFEADPEGIPLDPFHIESDPDSIEVPEKAEPVPAGK